MKKLVAILMAVSLVAMLTSCGEEKEPQVTVPETSSF